MNITHDEIISVFRKLAQYTPISQRINAFTVVDEGKYFTSDALVRSYEDYKLGYYWSRDWELSGADPSTMRKEWPVLGVEHKVSHITDIGKNSQLEDWWVIVGDVPNRLTQEARRTIFEVDKAVHDLMRYVLFSLKQFERASVLVDSLYYTVWDTHARLVYLRDKGVIQSFTMQSMTFYDMLFAHGGSITPVRSGFASDARVAAYKLQIPTCITDVPALDVTYLPTAKAAISNCNNC